MTTAQQILKTIGITTNARRLPTLVRRSRLRAAHLPVQYLWIAVALLAGGVLVALRRRGWSSEWTRGKKVRDVMIREVLTVDPSATLIEAAQRMREGNVGMLPVVEDGVLRGVITDRDIVVRAVARGADPGSARVSEWATRELACARPDWDVEDAMRLMAECQVGRLPVTDQRNRLVGIVTLSSLALRSRDEDEALHTAQEVSRRSARVS